MANKVGLREDEYASLATKISSAHEKTITELTEVLDRLEQLNQVGGAMHLEALSPQIHGFISEVRATKSTMEAVFSAHEEVIQSFRNGIDNIDVAC